MDRNLRVKEIMETAVNNALEVDRRVAELRAMMDDIIAL
jgi:hypothetical protein